MHRRCCFTPLCCCAGRAAATARMPDTYAWYVCLARMPGTYAWHACLAPDHRSQLMRAQVTARRRLHCHTQSRNSTNTGLWNVEVREPYVADGGGSGRRAAVTMISGGDGATYCVRRGGSSGTPFLSCNCQSNARAPPCRGALRAKALTAAPPAPTLAQCPNRVLNGWPLVSHSFSMSF